MLPLKILKNPLFKTIGVAVILYYALFSSRENPDSLSQRFSAENIEKNKEFAIKKVKFISETIKSSNELLEQQKQQESLKNNSKNPTQNHDNLIEEKSFDSDNK